MHGNEQIVSNYAYLAMLDSLYADLCWVVLHVDMVFAVMVVIVIEICVFEPMTVI